MEDKKKGSAKYRKPVGGAPLVPGSNIKGIGKMGQYRSGLRPAIISPGTKGSNATIIGNILGGGPKK